MVPGEPSNVRKAAYALLIAVAVGAAAGRILGVERVYETTLSWPPTQPRAMPTHGDNDRSRWDTVRALVDHGTYVIGHRHYKTALPSAVGLLAAPDALQAATLAGAGQQDTGIITEDGWKTIDKVLRPDTGDFYSSKPPLLSTLVAGLYWLLKHLLGWSITGDSWEVVRTILLLVNGLPFLFYLVLLARLAERYGVSDWGRLYVVTAACFATLVTPFLTTLNNHTVGTFCAVFALYPAVGVWSAREEGTRPPAYRFVLSGFFGALTACVELPAAAVGAALFGALVARAPGRTLAFFVPAAVLPVAAFFLTNYLAIGQLRPAYSEFGGPWYEYEGSHWSNPTQKTGIDFARNVETRGEYAFNVLLGHHGWFSLTPMWFLAAAGMIAGLVVGRRRAGPPVGHEQPDTPVPAGLREAIQLGPPGWGDEAKEAARHCAPAFLYPLTLGVSLVVIGFYLVRSDNYGGWTSGLRWLMWLTPLWLLCMGPALDSLAGRRWGRGLGYLLLAASALSASFPAWNPWRHPWLYRLLDWLHLVPY